MFKFQSTSQCVLANRDRDRTGDHRQAACQQSPSVCAFIPQEPGQRGGGALCRVAEPSGTFLQQTHPLKSDLAATQKPYRKALGAPRKEAPHSATYSLHKCLWSSPFTPVIKAFEQKKRTLPRSLLVIGFPISRGGGGEEDAIKANGLKLIACCSPG